MSKRKLLSSHRFVKLGSSFFIVVLLLLLVSLKSDAYTVRRQIWSGLSTTYGKDASFINGGPNWSAVADAAATEWNTSPNPFDFNQDAGSLNRLQRENIGGLLGRTDTYFSGLNITRFDIKVNSAFLFYDGSQGPIFPPNLYHLRSLLRHEFGHAMGICHSVNNTLMHATLPIGIIRNLDTDATNAGQYLYSSSYTGVPPETGPDPANCNVLPVATGTQDDTITNHIAYGGRADNWERFSATNAQLSTITRSNTVGSRASMAFNGERITWFYSGGPDRGNADVYIDNAFQQSINANMPTYYRRQIGKTWIIAPGNHTIEVRVTGGGYIDIDSFAVNIATVGANTYDNTDAQFRFFGTWAHGPAAGAYNNTQSLSNTGGSLFRFTFTGTQVQYVFTKAFNCGIAAVTIDNVNKGTIDMYDPGTLRQQSVLYNNLGAGTHVLNVHVTGTRNAASSDNFVDVDSLIVN